jgi:hypothetical protein
MIRETMLANRSIKKEYVWMTPIAIERKFVAAALHVEGVMRETLDYTNMRRDNTKFEFVIHSLADRQS